MIDSLVRFRDTLAETATPLVPDAQPYFLATVHRPANVDRPEALTQVLEILEAASEIAPVLFVTHPRTLARLRQLEQTPRLVETPDSVRDPRPGLDLRAAAHAVPRIHRPHVAQHRGAHRFRAACRRRRRSWASRASRCAPTPSAPARWSSGPTRWSDSTATASSPACARSCGAPGSRRRSRRCGTGGPPNGRGRAARHVPGGMIAWSGRRCWAAP